MLYEFYILGTLAPEVRSQYTKKPYLRFDKAPETFFLSALRASLTRLGREPSVSMRKKYPLEPRVYFRCYWGIKIKDDRFCYFWKPDLLVTDCTVREIYSERFFFFILLVVENLPEQRSSQVIEKLYVRLNLATWLRRFTLQYTYW